MSESSEKPEDQVEPADSSAKAKQGGRVTKGQLARDVAIYSIARLLLVVVIGAVILGVASLVGVAVPLLVAAIFAVLIALPLSLLLFAKLRKRVNEGIATFDAQRRADQADLRARLRGEGTSR
ncbi:DUF4229 domain-containing protein [Rhodococcus opacus]|uniref:DUF4229 domain-containing protein n=1 Tax=Rhodococcus opacus TaxID=37919 RepID=UPI001C479D35|nr:DUF4229 domain-containing protein [Rhodococcus opacus]MBV6761539.1 DUF4229 domain-containing protein [Rhodococcus opacus]